MTAPDEELARYSRVAIVLHWAIALLILVNWPLGHFSEAVEQQFGLNLVPLHKSIGLTVLLLSLARLGWRMRRPPPAFPPELPAWRRTAALITHRALYVLIVAVPLTGWLRTSSGKYPLTWFSLVDVPKLPVKSAGLDSGAVATSHMLLAWAMLLLVVIHVAAALHHHLWLRDATLHRMLPLRRRRGVAFLRRPR